MIISDRYRLEESIGEGAFSHVFRATDLRLGQQVALKLLSVAGVDAAGFERFCREAELAKRLQHPNTVRLLDFDLEAEPAPYIVYELLSGETLDRLIEREGAMSEARVAELASRVLSSLKEAHDAGVVHRDVKPGNVFVCDDDTSVWIKVLDFGIAKGTGPADVAVTVAGLLIGTPRYMPPEQVQGAAPAPSMDLYAVGMMMAEALTGGPLLRCSAAEACLEQLKPESIALPQLVQDSALGPIIGLATQKNLEIRYLWADEMLRDLDKVRERLSLESSYRPPAPTVIDEPEPRPRYRSEAPTTLFEQSEPYESPVSGPPVASDAGAARPESQIRWFWAALLLLVIGLIATALGAYALARWGAG
jgi:eukaryotic-like serine/threonine-protein kinase